MTASKKSTLTYHLYSKEQNNFDTKTEPREKFQINLQNGNS